LSCSSTLIVVGDDLDPEGVTSILGMEAHESWRRGDRQSFTRPDGTILLFKSSHDQGGWKHRIPGRYRDRPLSEQVSLWRARLGGLGDAIRSLRGRGWEVELDCFVSGSEILFLRNAELQELSGLGIDLILTFAGCRQSDDQRPIESS